MSSRIDRTEPDPIAGGDLGPRLQRFCSLLGVAGAILTIAGPNGRRVLATSGMAAPNQPQLEEQTLAAGRSTILADTQANGPLDARFYVGLLAHAEDGASHYVLSLFDQRPRSTAMAARLAGVAREAAAVYEIERQKRVIAAQRVTIADYAALEDHRLDLFDRASSTAKIGLWQCTLSDNKLTWTRGVFDLFELPYDTPLNREATLGLYTPEGRQRMEAARAAAIATCSEFSINCEIITAKGNRRWMRLTGAVEARDGVAHRIFGMKQDITEEKLMADRNRYLAEYDAMTGLANRALFQSRLDQLDAGIGQVSALLLVDLDGFKQVNDTYGHAVGDDCLKEAAQRLLRSCGDVELVARIGGDEFAVLLGSRFTASDAAELASDIVTSIADAMDCGGRKLTLGASVGVAQYRGGSSDDLFRQADIALYAAKADGRNTSRFYGAHTLDRAG